VRAFCQDRLGARQLEPLTFGVPARLRGIATHHATERLLEHLPRHAALPAADAVASSVERALKRLFGRTRGHLAALFELEAQQLRRVLTELLAADHARAPFRVRAVEQRETVALGPLTFNVRIDRIDELADGSLAIIDYKTGERATSAGWFAPRLTDAQVPLYASHSREVVTAAVVARLTPTGTRFSGLWPEGAFPARPTKAAETDMSAQLAVWRGQLAVLAAEFASGDTRIFVDDYEDAAAAYAPLTRIFEQLAVYHGEIGRW
jgi:RecB family exonuclease